MTGTGHHMNDRIQVAMENMRRNSRIKARKQKARRRE